MVYATRLSTAEDAIKLNRLATAQSFNVTVTNGKTLVIDAKSLLALFTMIGKDVNLVAPDHASPEEFMDFVKKLG